jgi:hypothetical protein
MGAAAAAAGIPSTLQQAMQWLKQLRDTPLVSYTPDMMQRAAGIRVCMKNLLTAHDVMGRPGPAMEQELLEVLKLICEVVVQLLRQMPAAAATLKQHAAHATTDTGARSNNSHWQWQRQQGRQRCQCKRH